MKQIIDELFDNLPEVDLHKAIRQGTEVSAVEEASREIEVAFATDNPVLSSIRKHGVEKKFYERLTINRQAMNLERINAGLCHFIKDHNDMNVDGIIGTVIPNSVSFRNGVAYCRVKLSDAEDVSSTVRKIVEGVATGISFGYVREEVERSAEAIDGLPVVNTIRYTPTELTLTPNPADIRTGFVTRSDSQETYRCIVRGIEKIEVAGTRGVTTHDANNQVRAVSMPKKSKTDENAVDEQEVAEDAATRSAKEVDSLHRVEIEVSGQEKAKRSAAEKVEDAVETEVLDEAAIRADERKKDRERRGAIEKVARSMNFDRKWIDEKIESEQSLDEIRTEAIDAWAEKDEMSKNSTGARSAHPDHFASATNRDDDYIDVVSKTLARRAMPDMFKAKADEKVDRSFEDFTLMDLARHALERSGRSVTKQSDVIDLVLEPGQRAGGGNHTISDFPDIMNAFQRTVMLQAYESAEVIYPQIASTISLPDLEETRLLRHGSFPDLEEVVEGEDYPAGTLSTGKETIKLRKFARTLKVTRDLLINDRLGVISTVAADIGTTAREKIEAMVVGYLLDNTNLSNGRAVFNDTDGNIVSPGTNISNTNLATIYDTFAKLRDSDGRRVRVRPSIILTGTGDRWVEAQQLLGSFDPARASDVSVFRARYTHIDSSIISQHDTKSGAWFVLAAPSQFRAGLQVGFLNGQQAPQVDTEIRTRNGGIETNVVLYFTTGCGDRNFGIYNEGS